jgi:hypothetical protein
VLVTIDNTKKSSGTVNLLAKPTDNVMMLKLLFYPLFVFENYLKIVYCMTMNELNDTGFSAKPRFKGNARFGKGTCLQT